ncbi:MAG TPA: TetR family transcriptional regulator C-terminal domain-containing protein [Jiangellaceae bacterium]
MPRVVDADARRTDLAEAVWRVIARDGLEGASVRRVAQEAGLSTGSLRHYFTSQSELLSFALERVGERLDERIHALEPRPDQRRHVQAMVEEMLPLDAERRAECEVWLAFTARALVDPSLAGLRASIDLRLREAFTIMVGRLADADLLRPGLSRDIEAERLYALVDGLIVHALLSPRPADERWVADVVAAHLDDLTSEALP